MPSSDSSNLNNNSGASISLWMEETILSPPPLTRNIETDICIVGTGIAGLTCAYLLLQEGKHVVVLDKGQIAGGQSARTTGHLTWILDDRYTDLKKLFGEEGIFYAAHSHRTAVDRIEEIIQANQIDCDFQRLNGYLFVPPGDSLDILDQELAAIKQAGMQGSKIDRAPIKSFDTGPCLEFPDQAQFHILKYLSGLVKAILRKGGQIYSYTSVQDCIDGEPCKVITDKHHEITAKAVIVATDTPINDRFMMHTKQAAYRTYVISAQIPKGYVPIGLYWDTPDPYHYIRIQKHATNSEKDWLIIGGEDHKTGQDQDAEGRYALLESWARERFPQMEKVEYRWSGQIIEPIDSLAFIGRNPHDQHTYIVTGDSGNGLTHGTIAAILMTDLIVGKRSPWASLYDPSRKTLAAASEFAKENLNVAVQYADWVLPGQVESMDQIPAGSGAIMREGLSKEAIYRDKEGGLHCFSAVCPHLGCIVAWNEGEKSWDCPCHGSRFDALDGHVLNGPAISPLKPCQK